MAGAEMPRQPTGSAQRLLAPPEDLGMTLFLRFEGHGAQV